MDDKHFTPGKPYSGANPIPNIQRFIDSLDKDKKERDKHVEDTKTDVAKPHESKPSDGVKGTKKTVTDPTTGGEVLIEDVDKDFIKAVENPQLSVPLANLGKETSVKTEASQSGEEYKRTQDITAPPDPVAPNSTADVPIHGEKTNILFHPTPSISYEPTFQRLEQRAWIICIGILAAIVILGKIFGGSLWGLFPTGVVVATGVWLWMKEVVRSGREVEWESEKNRGQIATQNLIPESVEWLNALMGIVWGLINPEMFVSVADTLEDVMQASLPGIVENVRVAEINQGNNPIRILSLRSLPDSHVSEITNEIHELNKKTKDQQEAAADEESGSYYNIEVSFAYHAQPSGRGLSSKARNLHMELIFYLGIKGLFGIPLPIWVELQGLVGTVRLRLHMTPEPPFLKALTFTLMGVPKVSAGCVPMVKKGVNVLNLPLISNFVNYAIAAAASQYVAPKSLTLDMGKILVGDDVQKEVDAIGVLWIRIHKAVGLSKQDIRGGKDGGSDPYITLSWSKFSKPMYSTRVITDDINPIWEETTALLVTTELIKADEQLSVQLWDSDRSSADDVVGKVELSMQKLIQNPGEMFPQVSELRGMDSDTSMPGKLHWEVGFYGKPHFRPALRTDGKNNDLPATLKDKPEFQDNKGSLDTESEDAVAHTPPDPLWPSGICSVIVHQIVSLSLENIKGSNGKRKGREYEPALEEGENSEEQGGEQPSSYCTIIMNDHLVYRTRSKFVTSQPIFNAGTERFMRDWRAGIVTVTVRDQRMREHDPILGVVSLKLSDILQTSSQVTRWYPLDGGIGFGRIRISLLFRSVETRLPPEMLGWDVGTFELLSERIVALGYKTHAKLKMRTGGSSGKIPKTQARATDEGDGIYWDIEKKDGKNNVRLPVRYRYRSPVVFEFHTASKRAADAYAIIWLHHLIDNEESNINIPIWKTAHGSRLTQNYVTEQNYATVTGLDDLQEVGRLQFRCRFKAGADEDHAQFVDDNDSRETQETWDACHAEGVRSRIVSSEIPEAVQDLHNKSLIDGRDVLQEADPKEKNKWLSKDGTDWTGAFGDDPAELVDGRGRKKTEPGAAINKRLPSLPSSEDDYGDSSSDGDDDVDLGIKDAHYTPDSSANGEASGANIDGTKDSGKELSGGQNKKDLHRRQRGLMQWKPARNARFALNETKFAVKRLKKKIAHSGREPDVETEV